LVMLRLAAFLVLGGLLVGCDAKVRSTAAPNETKTEIRVDTDRPRGVDVDVRPLDQKKVDVDVARPRDDKKVEVDVGRGGVKVDVDGKPLRERIDERREERRESPQP